MFKKSVVVGVSVTPEAGLEIAQVDYATKTVLKYGRKPVDYNVVRREIADLDIFKETLLDLLGEMDIPKGTELVLSLPTVNFDITDYPAALDDLQIVGAIEEELYDNQYFRGYELCTSYAIVNNTLQFNKVAYTSIQRATIIELVLFLKDAGYKVNTIDTSLNSLLHSLVYLDKLNAEPETNWVLLTIENSCCRVLSMLGKNYLDAYEEKISIGEVLSDAENYATVIAAVEPILKNLPSKYLFIVSKTNVISAEVVANKINYSAPIIYQEANIFRKEDFIEVSADVDPTESKSISPDVIGAAIYHDYALTSSTNFNFFNKTLGELYFNEQPPTLFNGKLVLTNEKLIALFVVFVAIVVGILLLLSVLYINDRNQRQKDIDEMQQRIALIQQYLDAHKNISADTFDEGEQIRQGLTNNKNIYTYYTIVGTEIPQKLWLTHLKLGDKVTIDGQADNIESVYAFFRNIKDYNSDSNISLQKLGLAASDTRKIEDFDKDALLSSLDADFYEFSISNDTNNSSSSQKDKQGSGNSDLPGDLEPIN